MQRKLKAKNCKVCGKAFVPMNSMAKVCSIECSIQLSKNDIQKKADKEAKSIAVRERREHRKAKERVKPLSKWLSEAQAVINKYVRLRDRHLGCVSCDKPSTWDGQWHCSHFFPRGRAAAVRFNLCNMHKSCSQCNNHMSGNLVAYEPELIRRIGKDKYEWLKEESRKQRRYDAKYCKRLIKIFNKKIKRLRA